MGLLSKLIVLRLLGGREKGEPCLPIGGENENLKYLKIHIPDMLLTILIY